VTYVNCQDVQTFSTFRMPHPVREMFTAEEQSIKCD